MIKYKTINEKICTMIIQNKFQHHNRKIDRMYSFLLLLVFLEFDNMNFA